MESAEATVRKIPEDRIKELRFEQILSIGCEVPEEWEKNVIIKGIAHEFAAKLWEFHKVSRTYNEDGTVTYRSALEVIIPPTPEDAI